MHQSLTLLAFAVRFFISTVLPSRTNAIERSRREQQH
jgi:hypothetical protein